MTRRVFGFRIVEFRLRPKTALLFTNNNLNGFRKDHRFPPERVELLHMLSKKEDVYERLARAIAPSIYENEDVKKGILLQLFGGTKKTHVASGRANFRYKRKKFIF